MSFGIWKNSTPFHRMWKTCGSGVSIHRGSRNSRSTGSSHWGHWWLAITSSGRQPAWNWAVSLLCSPLTLEWRVSFGHHPSHWPVWLVRWNELIDLPQLQSVRLRDNAFTYCQSVVFEGNGMERVEIQICQNYNPFNLIWLLLRVMVVMIERRLKKHPLTTRTP